MRELEKLKMGISIINFKEDWLLFSLYLNILSKDIRTNNSNLPVSLIFVMRYLIKLGKKYNIDMSQAWERWHRKASQKIYSSSI